MITDMEVNGKAILIEGKSPRIARLEQEWYEDIEDPTELIDELRKIEPTPDILTFWQRLPDTEAKFSYTTEPDPSLRSLLRPTPIGGRSRSTARLAIW